MGSLLVPSRAGKKNQHWNEADPKQNRFYVKISLLSSSSMSILHTRTLSALRSEPDPDYETSQ